MFGPFVTVSTFSSDEEALAIANGTDYGLGSGLWTRNLQRAHLVARELRSGMVWINCYKRVNPGSPFGGVGASGYGREMGFEVMREYTQVEVGLGQRRRADSALLPALNAMEPFIYQRPCRRAWCSARAASSTWSARSICWARKRALVLSHAASSAHRPRRWPNASARGRRASSRRR